jgi:DNA-binding transcriptional ArsR family regulator
MKSENLSGHCMTAAKFLSAAGDSKRLSNLRRVARKEYQFGELALSVGLSQSALSQHFAELHDWRLGRRRLDVQAIYCSSA